MADYRLSKVAKNDLLRIHAYGVFTFGLNQVDKYLNNLFDHFEIIASNPESFQRVDYIKVGLRRCVCGSDSIFYQLKNKKVEILTIVGDQDLDKIL